MAEEQVIKLLEEIRDLQKSHLENYQVALKNQQESIDLQKRTAFRAKIVQIVFLLLLAGLVAILVLSSKG